MIQKRCGAAEIIAKELNVTVSQVEAAIQLLDEGATVPFIARYRKEATSGLSDSHLRALEDRLYYLRELDERRDVILQTIREQEKLTPELEAAILTADTKTRLEDLYLPHRPKRRTKAQLAREAGLEPLAQLLWDKPTEAPETLAQTFINAETGIDSVEAAIEGARQILMERCGENADILNEIREYFWQKGILSATGVKNKINGSKFADYAHYSEAIHKIPSHRALALFRGRREGILQLSLSLADDEQYAVNTIARFFKLNLETLPSEGWLLETLRLSWKVKICSKLELELLSRLRESADEEAIRVFASNLRDLLLAAPAGMQTTLGLDPGIRTGVKAAVIDKTGKLLDYTTVFPLPPVNEWHQAIAALAKLVAKYNVELISIGNGTGSRETERLVAELIKMYPDLKVTKVMVSEAGASVYSASELASNELPDIDVTLRGAVSIARRLQDPLAELVKIEPKSIGVGQYQHDINQSRLGRSLEAVVEDCVNAVGVDVNTASAALLTRVSGLNENLAKQVVQYREQHGAFSRREQLKEVPRMGEKTFQQAAGFLRIMNGENPLDASAVHPEAYPLVEKLLADQKMDLQTLIGNSTLLHSVNAAQYTDEQFGLPTVQDVLKELEKPGRDPRPCFKTAAFKDGVEDISHLEVGMILEGVVSNVTNFGAFVDVGVHQDGLVHISALTNRFISDPRTIVKAGDIVTVRVIEVDKSRRRIGLSMRLQEEKNVSPEKRKKPALVTPKAPVKPAAKQAKKFEKPRPAKKEVIINTSMADALSKLKLGSK